jgi:hypothetical protein
LKAREGIAPAIAGADAAPDRGPIRISSVERVRGRVTAQARALHALSRPLWIIALCSLIGVAYLGRSALVPLALGLLLACVLSGVVETLCRYRVPRGLSASVLLVLVSLAIGGVIEMTWTPAQQWQGAARAVRPAAAGLHCQACQCAGELRR